MRLGEKLGVRWDFAFYQMILETGALKYRNGSRSGDVKPDAEQLCRSRRHRRRRARRELQGRPDRRARPSRAPAALFRREAREPDAERTRKVQEWGVLTKWQARFTRPITFSDLAAQWAPGSGGYARMLDGIAERFQEFCDKPDPRPELRRGRAARAETGGSQSRAAVGRGARQARHRGRQGRGERAALRLGVRRPRPGAATAKTPPMPFKVLNAPPPEPDKLAADTPPADPAAKILDTTPKAEAARESQGRRLAALPRTRAKAAARPRSRSSRSPLPPAPPSRWSRPRRAAPARSAACGPPATAARRR